METGISDAYVYRKASRLIEEHGDDARAVVDQLVAMAMQRQQTDRAILMLRVRDGRSEVARGVGGAAALAQRADWRRPEPRPLIHDRERLIGLARLVFLLQLPAAAIEHANPSALQAREDACKFRLPASGWPSVRWCLV
jgi:hypothetical protein